jgi:hypothetical protein
MYDKYSMLCRGDNLADWVIFLMIYAVNFQTQKHIPSGIL